MQGDFRPNRPRPVNIPQRQSSNEVSVARQPRSMDGMSLPKPQPGVIVPRVNNDSQAVRSPQVPPPNELNMDLSSDLPDSKKLKKPNKKWLLWLFLAVIGLVLVLIGSSFAWYSYQLTPVNSSSQDKKVVTIVSGTTANYIAKQLQDEGLIRSDFAFNLYTRISGTKDSLQAGVYRLSPSESTQKIVDHLIKGKTDSMNITFFPGGTITDNSDKPLEKKTDVTSVLKRAGYKDAEIKTALTKIYNHPVFADKPAGTSLEGYIYGETYKVSAGASVEDILTQSFDQLYKVVKDNNLVEGFKQHGLNLYQGITFASIVEREVSNHDDRRQAAQVFYHRLSSDTVLGSDVTFIYGANLLGVSPTINLDSPYNTRKVKGLPPGPIASPSQSSLLAVANPAPGNYMYFVAGDDGKTYFSKTEAEHEALAAKYCIKLCSEF